jgi:hypothetical protein
MPDVVISLLSNTFVMLGALFTLLGGLVAWQMQRDKKGTESMQDQVKAQVAEDPGRFRTARQPAGGGNGKALTAGAFGMAFEHEAHTRTGPPEQPAPPPVAKASRASDGLDDAAGAMADMF